MGRKPATARYDLISNLLRVNQQLPLTARQVANIARSEPGGEWCNKVSVVAYVLNVLVDKGVIEKTEKPREISQNRLVYLYRWKVRDGEPS